MALKKVKILSSIAGDTFSYAHGEIIEVEAEIAKAWNESGLSVDAPEGDVAAGQIEDLQARLADVIGARDGLATLNADLEGKLAAADAGKKGAIAEMAVHRKAASDAAMKIVDLNKALIDAANSAAKQVADLTKERDDFAAQASELGTQLAAALEKIAAAPAAEKPIEPPAPPTAETPIVEKPAPAATKKS